MAIRRAMTKWWKYFFGFLISSISIFNISCSGKASIDISELAEVLTDARAGDTIILKDGIYRDVGRILLNNNGTQSQPIVFRAETLGGAIFTGKSEFLLTGDYWHLEGFGFFEVQPGPEENLIPINLEGASYNRISQCFILDCGKKQLAYPVFQITKNSNYNRVDHNFFENYYGQGLKVRIGVGDSKNSVGNQIDHNYFLNVQRNIPNGGEAIQVGQRMDKYGYLQTYTVIEHNFFKNVNGDDEIISIKSSQCKIRYNTFENCDGAIWLRGGNKAEVYSNLLKNNKGGIYLFGSNHKVYNNYIEGSSTGIIARYGTDFDSKNLAHAGQSFQAVENSIIAHNTIINTTKWGFYFGDLKNKLVNGASSTFSPTNNLIVNNLILVREGTAFMNMADSTNQFEENAIKVFEPAQHGFLTLGVSQMNIDLKLQGKIYRPQPKSASVNKAILLDNWHIKNDFEGQLRDNMPDIGCDELGGNGKVHFLDDLDGNSSYEEFKDGLRREILM